MLDKYVTICSIYLPPDLEYCQSDLEDLTTQLPSPFLILRDLNAHNPIWGGDVLDDKGKIVEDFIANNPVSFLNDGSFTYHNIYANSYSGIDLSICSSSIFLDFSWSVDTELNGSDHFPIYLTSNRNIPKPSSPKWKLEQADWENFKKDATLSYDFESFSSHIEAYDYFVETMLKSGNTNIPKTKSLPHRPARWHF